MRDGAGLQTLCGENAWGRMGEDCRLTCRKRVGCLVRGAGPGEGPGMCHCPENDRVLGHFAVLVPCPRNQWETVVWRWH